MNRVVVFIPNHLAAIFLDCGRTSTAAACQFVPYVFAVACALLMAVSALESGNAVDLGRALRDNCIHVRSRAGEARLLLEILQFPGEDEMGCTEEDREDGETTAEATHGV